MLIDVQSILIKGSEFKVQYNFNQQIYGHVIDITIRQAYQARTAIPQQAAAERIGNISDLKIQDLNDSVQITFLVEETPTLNLNSSNGVFAATVCGFYNVSSSKWIPFGSKFVSDCAGNCPLAASSGSESEITCSTTHLTAFATLPSQVGCDLVASSVPLQRDECCLCAGLGTSCCDWRRIASANNVARNIRCIGQLDKCLVCNGQNSPFISLEMKNISGICDYQGVPCLPGLIPNACGVCDSPEKELLRFQSQGLCDCNTNPKLPTELGGGLVVDRCGICNGNNASMDDCGFNGNIPAYDPNGLFQVCHSGGRGSAQVPRWDMSCRGCDNISRPDLPFIPTRRPFPGGVQSDICGICGGDGTNCPGCDGIAGSKLVRDVCRVCGGRNDSCLGCDGVRSPLTAIYDGCHECGGKQFGACVVTYNFSFTQAVIFSQLIGFEVSPGRDQRFEVLLLQFCVFMILCV